MKVYFGKPRNHWYSPYTWLCAIFFWKDWAKDDGPLYPEYVEKWADYLTPISKGIQWVLNKVHPELNYVKVDYWDTWSMDHTLAPIILPMLKQLKETKHGYALVDDEDVPKHLQSIYAFPDQPWEWDKNAEARYEWILDQMIWSFEQLCNNDHEAQFYDHSEVPEGAGYMDSLGKIKIDMEGLQAHNERIDNGLKLFGKYFRSLWD